jgi:hypothetical protein
MWNKAFKLNTARRLEQNNSVALEPALELRPQIFDVGSRDDSLAVFPFLESRSEFSDSRHDVCARSQCETRDVGVTLLRRRTKLPHRTKDDYPLPSGTGSL